MPESTSFAKLRSTRPLWRCKVIFWFMKHHSVCITSHPQDSTERFCVGIWPLYSHSCRFKSRFFVRSDVHYPPFTDSKQQSAAPQAISEYAAMVELAGDRSSHSGRRSFTGDWRGFLCFQITSLLFCLCVSNKGSNGEPISPGQSTWPHEPPTDV